MRAVTEGESGRGGREAGKGGTGRAVRGREREKGRGGRKERTKKGRTKGERKGKKREEGGMGKKDFFPRERATSTAVHQSYPSLFHLIKRSPDGSRPLYVSACVCAACKVYGWMRETPVQNAIDCLPCARGKIKQRPQPAGCRGTESEAISATEWLRPALRAMPTTASTNPNKMRQRHAPHRRRRPAQRREESAASARAHWRQPLAPCSAQEYPEPRARTSAGS